jgi:hypothetical protein
MPADGLPSLIACLPTAREHILDHQIAAMIVK